jgi:hypothetical protein
MICFAHMLINIWATVELPRCTVALEFYYQKHFGKTSKRAHERKKRSQNAHERFFYAHNAL